MTHQSPLPEMLAGADAGRQVAQLREVLALVRSVGGAAAAGIGPEAALDEAARVSSAYGDALPIVQRRFDALVGETVAWAAAGVEALSLAGGPSPAAAARLADELGLAIGDLKKLLRL
jgi:hypothetical protein